MAIAREFYVTLPENLAWYRLAGVEMRRTNSMPALNTLQCINAIFGI
jgi:hypothetical protein